MKIYKLAISLEPDDKPDKPVTGKYCQKKYKCSNCGHETFWGTNHWGEFYNTRCPKCNKYVTWKCTEKPPEGYGLPEPWKEVNPRDILDI